MRDTKTRLRRTDAWVNATCNILVIMMYRFSIGLCVFAVLALGFSTRVVAEVYPLSSDDVVGSVTTIKSTAADTLVDIARRHGLGYTDVVRANPDIDPWLPGEGAEIVLPTQFVLPDAPRRGIVLNLAEYRLYYFPPAVKGAPTRVVTYPISIGRMDWETPLGRTKVVAKANNPNWYVPESVHQERKDNGDPPLPRVVPAGPDNPLGSRAMRLGLPGYLIHGTNRPAGVGMRVTHGCIRMFPEDIEVFFEQIPVGTPVRIVNQPIKFGYRQGDLMMEAHEILAQPEASDDVANTSALVLSPLSEMTRQFVAFSADKRLDPDWVAMEQIVEAASGIPVSLAVSNATITEQVSATAD